MNTEGIFCQKVVMVGSPVLYTIGMFSVALTGKQPEIEECIRLLEKSPDKMQYLGKTQMDKEI